MTAFIQFVLLLGISAVVLLNDAAASPTPTQRESFPLNSGVFTRPVYTELEKEGMGAWKNQDEDKLLTRSLQNDFDAPGYGHKNKLVFHRFTDRVIYPAELMSKKRNFDEIDRSGFSGFNKRNFDEIDRSGFSSFNKRNLDEIDRSGFSSFNKRNFDEIDQSGFSPFYKRNFDEIDRSGFSGFNKRNFDEIDRSGFSGFNRKRNFDEIDRSGFSGFNKRNFDEIDRSGVPGFAKRSIASRSKFISRQRR